MILLIIASALSCIIFYVGLQINLKQFNKEINGNQNALEETNKP